MSVIYLSRYVYNYKLLVFWELRLIHSGDLLVNSGVSTSAKSSVNPLTHGDIEYWVNRAARVTLEVREERHSSNIPVCVFTPKEPCYFPFALLNNGACLLLGLHLNMSVAKCLCDVSH